MEFSDALLKFKNKLKVLYIVEIACYVICVLGFAVFMYFLTSETLDENKFFTVIMLCICGGTLFFNLVVKGNRDKLFQTYVGLYTREVVMPALSNDERITLNMESNKFEDPDQLDNFPITLSGDRSISYYYYGGAYNEMSFEGVCFKAYARHRELDGDRHTTVVFKGIIGELREIDHNKTSIVMYHKNLKHKKSIDEKYFEYKTENSGFDKRYKVRTKNPVTAKEFFSSEVVDAFVQLEKLIGPHGVYLHNNSLRFAIDRRYIGVRLPVLRKINYDAEVQKIRVVKDAITRLVDLIKIKN